MKQYIKMGFAVASLLTTEAIHAQVVNTGLGEYRLTLGANFPRNFTIGGTLYTTGSAFNVRGDQMGPGFTTGEVFRTVAPAANNTFWRLYSGGDAAANERGRLYALTGSTSFNVQAPSTTGNLWLRNSLSNGLRLNNGTALANIGIYNNNPTDGFVGIGPDAGIIGTQGPWSRLHLDNGGAVITSAYRPWMKNGIYYSGNNDMMYVGQLFRAGADESDAVIAWGDNALAPAGPDHLRFLFMGGGDEGFETMRLTGDGFYGIGDFNSAGLQPDERLDVLNRTARLRALPVGTTYQAPVNDQDKLVVVRSDGRLNWRDAASITGQCDWIVNTQEHVVTAYTGMPCVPDDGSGVGVGLSSPKAKLDVFYTGNTTHGLAGTLSFSSVFQKLVGGRAVDALAGPALTTQFATGTMLGVNASAGNAQNATGVVGKASNGTSSPGTSTDLIGVQGTATANSNAGRCIGIYGGATGATNNWAGWFDGNVNLQGGNLYINQVFAISDEELKESVQPLQNSTGILSQLQPQSYTFTDAAHPGMVLPEGQQMGLLAQQLEQVLPDLVSSVHVPAVLDSLGSTVAAAYDYKTVNYLALVPLLISASQEQNGRLNVLSEQLQVANEQLAACCAGTVDQRSVAADNRIHLRTERLSIAPNPFPGYTTLRYYVAAEGRMRLEVSSEDGRLLEVLREERTMEGEHSYEWNATGLQAGTYFVALVMDGNVVVKRVVNVNN